MSGISKCTESPEKIITTDHDADIEEEKVTFTIGHHTDDEEIAKHRQMILDNIQVKKKRRKKKRNKGKKHADFTEEELNLRQCDQNVTHCVPFSKTKQYSSHCSNHVAQTNLPSIHVTPIF